MFSFYYIFLYPNASHTSIKWFSDVLDAKWTIFLLSILLIDFIVLACYYFLAKPTQKAVMWFWIITTLLVIVCTVIGYFNLYVDRNMLSMEGTSWGYEHTLVSILTSLISSVEAFLIVLCIFLILSQLPVKWQLKAMRRYPFNWLYGRHHHERE